MARSCWQASSCFVAAFAIVHRTHHLDFELGDFPHQITRASDVRGGCLPVDCRLGGDTNVSHAAADALDRPGLSGFMPVARFLARIIYILTLMPETKGRTLERN